MALSAAAALTLDSLRELAADPIAAAELRSVLGSAEPPSAEPLVYTAETLAAELGVTTRTVRRYIEQDGLRATKKGDRWVMLPEDVRAWATSGDRPNPACRPRRTRAQRTSGGLAAAFEGRDSRHAA